MQLAPIDECKRRISLIMENKPSWPVAARDGCTIFWNGLDHVVFLKQTHRFVDTQTSPPLPCPVLPKLLAYMRAPPVDASGKRSPMDEALWGEIQSWAVMDGNDPRLQTPRVKAGFEMAIAWEAVARLMQYRAARDASEFDSMVM